VEQETGEYTAGMNLALSEVELPVRLRWERPMTDEELLRFCEANEALRIERDADGEILVMTPSGNRTGRRNAYVIQMLGTWADADGRGYHFDSNTGFTLPDGSMRMPDAAWVEAARWDVLSAEEKDGFSPLCPDFVIELRSKTDSLPVLEAKMAMWIANGAEVGWLIDPERKVVEIYRRGRAMEVLEDPSWVQGDGPVAGFELVMERVWQ
jgi:Uma2 family endonuclease